MMGRFWLFYSFASLISMFVIAGCQPSETKEIGKVADCGNGSYFSLEAGDCKVLAGHSLVHDQLGFERIQVENGVTVPQAINGRTPFIVSFSYEVSRRSSFDLVVKRVEYGTVMNDNYSNWEKVTVDPGKGEVKVRLYPKDGKAMPPGRANNYVQGSWQTDVGYIVEVRGGDRFEDEDADSIDLWRVAGLEINEAVPDDPDAKALILGDLEVASSFVSCGPIRGQLNVLKSDEDLTLVLGLKDPGNNWKTWGEKRIALAKGAQGPVQFDFTAASPEGQCPPPGSAVSVNPWKAEPGQYLLQLDLVASDGQQIQFDNNVYQAVRSSVGVEVQAAATAGLTQPQPLEPASVPNQPAAPPAPPPVATESAEEQLFRLSDLELADVQQSCSEVKVSIEIYKTNIDLSLTMALKQPGDNWLSWGSQTLEVPASSRNEILNFSFKAQDEEGRCAPSGEPVKDPNAAKPGQYLIQLDIFDSEGKKYDDPNAKAYALVRNWAGVKVAKAR